MIKVCRKDQETILQRIREGKIDAAALSSSHLVDDIILSMKKNGVLDCIRRGFPDKRADNTVVPFELVLAPAIAAKMKTHSSLTDIPFALTDHRTLSELGYSLWDTNRDLKTGLMREGTLRFLLDKYSSDEMLRSYNDTVQQHIFPALDIEANIHILDCTKVEVNLKNTNYEGATVVSDNEGNVCRGYKLATLRGIVRDSGIIEEIAFGSISTADLNLSRDMVMNTPMLKPGDVIINDRGFISRELLNFLKAERQVDTYIPLRKNMVAYKMAVSAAIEDGKWEVHPNKKRRNQKIALVTNLGDLWPDEYDRLGVPINVCVVWDVETDNYFVFATTDISKTAKQIIQMYELRPEIEEDYRQIKDFWKLEDFRSKKLNVIAFHIVCVLLGYMFFQLYTMLPDGYAYAGKSLPVVLKNYAYTAHGFYVLYSDDIFGVVETTALMDLYVQCNEEARVALKNVMQK